MSNNENSSFVLCHFEISDGTIIIERRESKTDESSSQWHQGKYDNYFLLTQTLGNHIDDSNKS